MTATLPASAAEAVENRIGSVEAAGVDYLPEDARDSGPRNLSAVFLGANLTWTNVVFGAFAILFGLSFWQTVTSMAVGIAAGTLAVLPTAIIGPRTGTNMTVPAAPSSASEGGASGPGWRWRSPWVSRRSRCGPVVTRSSLRAIDCSALRRATSCTPSRAPRWPR